MSDHVIEQKTNGDEHVRLPAAEFPEILGEEGVRGVGRVELGRFAPLVRVWWRVWHVTPSSSPSSSSSSSSPPGSRLRLEDHGTNTMMSSLSHNNNNDKHLDEL